MNRVRPTNPFVEFEEREIEQSIPDRFAAQAAQHPDRVAVRSRHHEFTCREFDREANRVAQTVLAMCGSRISVCVAVPTSNAADALRSPYL